MTSKEEQNLYRTLNLISQRYFSSMSADKMTNPVILEIILMNAHDEEGNLLDLEKLLKLEDRDFWHDIIGIYCHTDTNGFSFKDNYLPRCGFIKKKEDRKMSFRLSCTNIHSNNPQILKITVEQEKGERECLEGFVFNLKEEIPRHGFYPCTEKKIIKEK